MTSAITALDTAGRTRDKRLVVIVWAALTAITLLAWQLAPGHSGTTTGHDEQLVAGIVVLGLVKCRLIIRHFMETRHAPRWLQLTTDAWLITLWATLLTIHLHHFASAASISVNEPSACAATAESRKA
ncbi:cytochrome C oxidase subunit IV family protein [Nocardia gipuzkoensis]